MRIDIQALNLERSTAKMKDRGKALKNGLQRILQKALFIVEGQAKRESPVRTGRMRASITEGRELYPTYARIGPTVTYAKYVHKHNPFMDRAAKKSVPDIKEAIRDEIKEIIK